MVGVIYEVCGKEEKTQSLNQHPWSGIPGFVLLAAFSIASYQPQPCLITICIVCIWPILPNLSLATAFLCSLDYMAPLCYYRPLSSNKNHINSSKRVVWLFPHTFTFLLYSPYQSIVRTPLRFPHIQNNAILSNLTPQHSFRNVVGSTPNTVSQSIINWP